MSILIRRGKPIGEKMIWATLHEAETGTDTGEWISTEGFVNLTFQFRGITTGTVQMRGSNAPTIPQDSEDEFQLGDDITADGIYVLCAPVRWVKAKITVATSIDLDVYMWGARW